MFCVSFLQRYFHGGIAGAASLSGQSLCSLCSTFPDSSGSVWRAKDTGVTAATAKYANDRSSSSSSCCLCTTVWGEVWRSHPKSLFTFPLQMSWRLPALSVLLRTGTWFCSRVSVPWSTPSTLFVSTRIITQIAESVNPRSISSIISSSLNQTPAKTKPQLPLKVRKS